MFAALFAAVVAVVLAAVFAASSRFLSATSRAFRADSSKLFTSPSKKPEQNSSRAPIHMAEVAQKQPEDTLPGAATKQAKATKVPSPATMVLRNISSPSSESGRHASAPMRQPTIAMYCHTATRQDRMGQSPQGP